MNYGKHLNEEMDDYYAAVKRHKNYISDKREFLDRVLRIVEEFGVPKTREIYDRVFSDSLSMDAPNKPGYYRANND